MESNKENNTPVSEEKSGQSYYENGSYQNEYSPFENEYGPKASYYQNQTEQNGYEYQGGPDYRQYRQDYQNEYQEPQKNPFHQNFSQNDVNGFSIAALILGCLSLVTCCCAGLGGIVFGALGIILALFSRNGRPMQTPAKIGMGLSIAGAVLGILLLLVLLLFGNISYHISLPSSEDYRYEYSDDILEDYFDYYYNNAL